jgi:uncharacterized protein YciI
MFIILLRYSRPLEEVDALLDGHRAFLDKHYASGRFLLSGRRVPRVGGVILARGDDEVELGRLLGEDPFHAAGVAAYEVIRFEPTRWQAAIADCITAELPEPDRRA